MKHYFIALVGLSMISISVAKADSYTKFCNDTDSSVGVTWVLQICAGGYFDLKCLNNPDSNNRHIYISGWYDMEPGKCSIKFSSPMIKDFFFTVAILNSDGSHSPWKFDVPLYSEINRSPAIARFSSPFSVCVPNEKNKRQSKKDEGFEIISERGWAGIPGLPCDDSSYPVELNMVAVPANDTVFTVAIK